MTALTAGFGFRSSSGGPPMSSERVPFGGHHKVQGVPGRLQGRARTGDKRQHAELQGLRSKALPPFRHLMEPLTQDQRARPRVSLRGLATCGDCSCAAHEALSVIFWHS
jgi:hypothetical protein